MYTKNCVLDLPFSLARHTETQTRDRSIYRRHVTLGDGIKNFPVKIVGNGYNFDGVSQHVTGLYVPEGPVTVSYVVRVGDDVSVVHEHDVSLLENLMIPGGFAGELLYLRAFSIDLDAGEKLLEEKYLLTAVNNLDVPKYLINDLVASGQMALYHDYRHGSFFDMSSNGNHGVPNPASVWDEDFLDLSASGAKVVVSDSDSLKFGGTGTIVIMADFASPLATEYVLIEKKNVDIQFSLCYFLGLLCLQDSLGNVRTRSVPMGGENTIFVTFGPSEKAKLFVNGLFHGEFSDTSVIQNKNVDLLIGPNCLFPMKVAMLVNRKLDEKEIYALNEALTENYIEDKLYDIEKIDLKDKVDLSDFSLIAAYCTDSKYNKIYNLKNDYDISSIGLLPKFYDLKSLYSTYGSIDTGIKSMDDYTMLGWVKVNEIPVDGTGIALFGVGSAGASHPDPYYGGVSIVNIGDELFFKYAHLGQEILSPQVWDDIWYHLCYVVDGNDKKVRFFVNGVLVGEISSVGIPVSSDNLRFFGLNSSSASLVDSGMEFALLKIYNQRKSEDWVKRDVNIGNNWSFSFAAQDSIGNETAGKLSNSDFEIRNGTWKIGTEIANGKRSKVIECVAEGKISFDFHSLEEA